MTRAKPWIAPSPFLDRRIGDALGFFFRYGNIRPIFSLFADLIPTASYLILGSGNWSPLLGGIECCRMESVRKVSRSFELGGCTVNPEDGSLTSPGRSVRLEPLQMDLLVFLCSRAGQVVTKDEILETVWRGRFISDDTVKSTFYQLRKALNDSPRKPRYIETIPKRGYRVLIDPIPLERPGGSGTPGTIATDLFRKGAALLSGQPSAAALKQARLYLERAIESDPDHAESGAALAHTYIHLVTFALGKGQDLLPRAKALAARASENDPRLSSARLAFGITRLLCDWEVAEAEKSFRNAIALDSGDSAPHRWLARLLSFNNMHTEAVAEARAALQADPLSLGVRRDLVETLFLARLYEEAIAQGQLLLQMSAQAADVQLGLSWIYYTVGDMDRAYDAVYAGFKARGHQKRYWSGLSGPSGAAESGPGPAALDAAFTVTG